MPAPSIVYVTSSAITRRGKSARLVATTSTSSRLAGVRCFAKMSTMSLPEHVPTLLSSVSTGDGATFELPSILCTRSPTPASNSIPPRHTACDRVMGLPTLGRAGGFTFVGDVLSAMHSTYASSVRHALIGREQHHLRGVRHRAKHQHLAVERGDASRAEVHRSDHLTAHELLRSVVHRELRARSFDAQLRSEVDGEFERRLSRLRKSLG